jgi:3-methyladenine DNA glycosylase/8-oxoguanine DNA glycosylase
MEARAQLRIEVVPRSPLLLPGGGADGVLRRRGSVLERLLHVHGHPVLVRAAYGGGRSRVLLGAWGPSRGACSAALERMRFAFGLDDDLTEFHRRFRDDPLIGRAIRAAPGLRPARRPEPFEALAWAICEQLIEFSRAAAIERRIVARLGRRAVGTSLCDLPSAATLAGAAPALLESFDLAGRRAIALRAAAREVAVGGIDLADADPERGWRRLCAIPEIGSWTVESLALHGQGRFDQVPAGDLALRKLVGRLLTGDPRRRVDEAEVRRFFAPYAPWSGLAATFALRGARLRAPLTRPVLAGTRR